MRSAVETPESNSRLALNQSVGGVFTNYKGRDSSKARP